MDSKVKYFLLAVMFTSFSILYLSRKIDTRKSITRMMNYSKSYFDDAYTSRKKSGIYKNLFSKKGSHNVCIFDTQTAMIRSEATNKLGSRVKPGTSDIR